MHSSPLQVKPGWPFLAVLGLVAAVALTAWLRSPPAPPVATSPAVAATAFDAPQSTGNVVADRTTDARRLPVTAPTATQAPDERLAAHLRKVFQAVPGATYEITNLAMQYDSLSQAARRGDLVAARTLHLGLKTCPAYLPRDDRELGQLRAQIDSRERSNFRMPDEPPERGHARLSALLERCGMLQPGAYEPLYALIAQLAAAGDHEARLEFPFADQYIDGRAPDAAQRRAEHPRLALEYVQSELAAGNAQALRAMERIYRDGRLLPADPVLSYAYAYAATFGPGDHRVLLETLPGQAARLDAEQRARAERLAREIYQRCCH